MCFIAIIRVRKLLGVFIVVSFVDAICVCIGAAVCCHSAAASRVSSFSVESFVTKNMPRVRII